MSRPNAVCAGNGSARHPPARHGASPHPPQLGHPPTPSPLPQCEQMLPSTSFESDSNGTGVPSSSIGPTLGMSGAPGVVSSGGSGEGAGNSAGGAGGGGVSLARVCGGGMIPFGLTGGGSGASGSVGIGGRNSPGGTRV